MGTYIKKYGQNNDPLYNLKKSKFYLDYMKDKMKKDELKSIDDDTPESGETYEVGPFNDYDEWMSTYDRLNKNPVIIYKVITRHKEDTQQRMFGYQPIVKYIVPYSGTITKIYGEWDMETGEGVLYPKGKRTDIFIKEGIIKRVLNRLNG